MINTFSSKPFIIIALLSCYITTAVAQGKKIFYEETFQIADMEQKSAELKQEMLLNPSLYSKASSNFDIHYLGCNWEVDPAIRYIKGDVKIGFTITERANTITLDLADQLLVDSILFHNAKIPFYRPYDTSLIVNFEGFIEKGTIDYITIFYQGIPPISTGITSFKNSLHNNIPVLWTLSEPYGGRDWWPCKNGLNDKADSMDISITTPAIYSSSSNGVLIGENIQNDKKTSYWKHRYPIATYLVAFAATNYTILRDSIALGNVMMPLMDYAYPEKESDFLAATAITKRTLTLLHNTFTPYPFINERYGHTQFGFSGGMEHQTNSFMNNMSENLIVHEMAHQWFGDKITCGSWKDTWLNEGFAEFCTNFNIEKNHTKAELISLYTTQLKSITSKPNGSVYVQDTSSVGKIFDSRLTYKKGAWVLKMLRWKLGDSVFFQSVRNYLNDPQLNFSYALTPDLQKHFEKTSGKDLSGFFNNWVYSQGFPSYNLQWATVGNRTIQTILSQTTSDTSVLFFEMPVPILFKNGTRDTTIIIDHIKNGQANLFNIGFIPDTAYIDPDLMIIAANNTVGKVEVFPTKDNIVVFPNPVGNAFNVLLRNMTEGVLHLSLHNSAGQVVWRKRYGGFNGQDQIVVPSMTLSSGYYFLSIHKDDDPVIIKRILR